MPSPPQEIVHVELGPRSYDIVITSNDWAGLGRFAKTRLHGSLAYLVSDENVKELANTVSAQLAGFGFRTAAAIMPPGERQKSLGMAASVYDQLARLKADRHTTIVAVGGGVVGDLGGFVAATFARGIPLLMVPTTLLAMVDSSVGGKVAVNHPLAKNLIGAFHQPVGVWIDTGTLATLPAREYRSGLAEVVKYGVIFDPELFAYLEKNKEPVLAREPAAVRFLVARRCRLKADVVQQDEREETGIRALLNYGHTFAHAFESVGGYGQWLHGEAVAAGMVCAAALAERLGLASAEYTRRQVSLLQAFSLPIKPQPWPVDQLLKAMALDKKAVDGHLRFILSRQIGSAEVRADVPEAEVRMLLESLTT